MGCDFSLPQKFRKNSLIIGQGWIAMTLFALLGMSKKEIDALYTQFTNIDQRLIGHITCGELFYYCSVGDSGIVKGLLPLFDADEQHRLTFAQFVGSIWNLLTFPEDKLGILLFFIKDVNDQKQISMADVKDLIALVHGKSVDRDKFLSEYYNNFQTAIKSDFVTLKQFLSYTELHGHQTMIAPLLKLQLVLREQLGGTVLWLKLTRFRAANASKFEDIHSVKLLLKQIEKQYDDMKHPKPYVPPPREKLEYQPSRGHVQSSTNQLNTFLQRQQSIIDPHPDHHHHHHHHHHGHHHDPHETDIPHLNQVTKIPNVDRTESNLSNITKQSDNEPSGDVPQSPPHVKSTFFSGFSIFGNHHQHSDHANNKIFATGSRSPRAGRNEIERALIDLESMELNEASALQDKSNSRVLGGQEKRKETKIGQRSQTSSIGLGIESEQGIPNHHHHHHRLQNTLEQMRVKDGNQHHHHNHPVEESHNHNHHNHAAHVDNPKHTTAFLKSKSSAIKYPPELIDQFEVPGEINQIPAKQAAVEHNRLLKDTNWKSAVNRQRQ